MRRLGSPASSVKDGGLRQEDLLLHKVSLRSSVEDLSDVDQNSHIVINVTSIIHVYICTVYIYIYICAYYLYNVCISLYANTYTHIYVYIVNILYIYIHVYIYVYIYIISSSMGDMGFICIIRFIWALY